ncbi:MAG: phosphatidate cytidylyltransferase [Betaproteobacteria bacterium]|nr:phosphatidate cytidylyltransferase [Betaproteobacteria bacterium]
MLGLRLLTAAVLVPLALAGLFMLSNALWALASGVFVLIGAWEWSRLAGGRGMVRIAYTVVVAVAGVAVYSLSAAPSDSSVGVASVILAAAVAFWILAAVPWLVATWHVRSPVLLHVVGAVVLIPAWLGGILLQREPVRFLVLMAVVWVADSGAYFVGRKFGRRKLAPRISPGKSWEGVAGAAVAVLLYYFVVNRIRPGALPGDGLAGLLFLELMLALSIVGDLFESWMKREAGVKDSGTLLPGHGGVLDRIDSLTSTLPAAALMVSMSTLT